MNQNANTNAHSAVSGWMLPVAQLDLVPPLLDKDGVPLVSEWIRAPRKKRVFVPAWWLRRTARKWLRCALRLRELGAAIMR